MPVGIEAWVTQIPPITRWWLILAVLTSLAVVSDDRHDIACLAYTYHASQQCQLVTPLQLYFSFNTAVTKVQVSLAVL